jgi:hypothetical protein
MSLARRLRNAPPPGGGGPVRQVEFIVPGTYDFQVWAGVTKLSGVGIAAGVAGQNTPSFAGGPGGDLHWRNDIPVTPGEWLTATVGNGDGMTTGNKITSLKRGATELILARANRVLAFPTLGGGGGKGGLGGSTPSGLGGGGPGYMGDGGPGGNYFGDYQGGFPQADSGGGRGGDMDGIPTGWANERGEGTGLLGRAPDKVGSLGTVRCGAGTWGNGSAALNGGLRLLSGGDRSYPDNAPDKASAGAATFVSAANGSGTLPLAVTYHTSAQPGDIVLFRFMFSGSGSTAGMSRPNWNDAGQGVYWKQITQEDIDASTAGTVQFLGTAPGKWSTTVYRGASMVTSRTSGFTVTPPGNLSVPGFTKRLDCRRVIAFLFHSGPGSGAAPTGFTSRTSVTDPRIFVCDKAPTDYADGTSVVFPGVPTDGGAIGVLLELN